MSETRAANYTGQTPEVDALRALGKVLNAAVAINDRQLAELIPFLKLRTMARQDCFVREGQHPDSFAFVYRGLFRYFYSDPEGHEFTKGFFPERSFIASYSALIQQRGSYFSIQALEDSVILEIEFGQWRSLAEREICWQKFLVYMLEKGYCTKEAREREFLLLNAEQRYRSFLETYPGLEQRIKQYMVASYLGITPVALSRLRRKTGRINPG